MFELRKPIHYPLGPRTVLFSQEAEAWVALLAESEWRSVLAAIELLEQIDYLRHLRQRDTDGDAVRGWP